MAGRAGAILPIALGVVLARWGGAVGAPRSSQRLRVSRGRARGCSPEPRNIARSDYGLRDAFRTHDTTGRRSERTYAKRHGLTWAQ